MSYKRILLGGLVAGVIMAVLDAIANVALFGSGWDAAYAALGLHPSPAAQGGFWITFDLVNGILIVWLYAAMRPRFGAGAGTAVRAALVQWFVLHYTMASHIADGVFPASLLAKLAACELVSALLGGLAGARLYRED
jgi:hypothetical protein